MERRGVLSVEGQGDTKRPAADRSAENPILPVEHL
jgi:hypothetical protein